MKKFITITFLSMSIAGFSQVKLEGVIKDSLGSPLELANVIAINKATKSLDSYGITNDEGRFRLDLKKNTSYSIQASYIGMKSLDEVLETKEENIKKYIIHYEMYSETYCTFPSWTLSYILFVLSSPNLSFSLAFHLSWFISSI